MKIIKVVSSLLVAAFIVLFVSFSPGSGHFVQVGAEGCYAASWEFVDSNSDSWSSSGGFSCGSTDGITIWLSGAVGKSITIDHRYTYKIEYYRDGALQVTIPSIESYNWNSPSVPAGSTTTLYLYRMLKNSNPTISVLSPSPNGTLFPSQIIVERGA